MADGFFSRWFRGLPLALLGLLLATGALACGGESEETAVEPIPAPSSPPVPDRLQESNAEELADLASRLAGLAGGDEPVWRVHAAAMDELWARIDERHLSRMRAWAGVELQPSRPEVPLFYPFGGPDLASAYQFFPAASAYVLVGLEPPGEIPSLGGLEGEELAAELERLRSGLEHLASAGYFVTIQMERDFAAAQRLDGFLPVLYLTLARLGQVPTKARWVVLDEEGVLIDLDSTRAVASPRGVEIRFRPKADADAAERAVYYFSQDLSDQGLESTPGFGRWLQKTPFNTYMKSAEYLPHMEGFETFGQLVLAGSQTLLQDDSGMPYRALDPERFEIRRFGAYTATLSNYRQWFQEDLRLAYERRTHGDLDFDIGYNSRISGSCLIWAERTVGGP